MTDVRSVIKQNLQGSYSLHVSGLNKKYTDEKKLTSVFKEYDLQSCLICRDSKTNQSLGSGYLLLPTEEIAFNCLKDKNFSVIDNKEIKLQWALDKDVKQKLFKLYFVVNENSSEKEIFLYFNDELGFEVLTVKIFTNKQIKYCFLSILQEKVYHDI